MIPKKTELRKLEKAEANPERSPKHMAWIRRVFVCAAWASEECEGPNHAHHVRTAATAGTGMKPSDFQTVPLCAKHHSDLHTMGSKTFEEKHGVDLMAEARRLAAVSPHKIKGAA